MRLGSGTDRRHTGSASRLAEKRAPCATNGSGSGSGSGISTLPKPGPLLLAGPLASAVRRQQRRTAAG